MALIKKLIRQISKILCEKRLIIPINSQLREPITPIYDGPQSSPLFLILYTLYLSDIPRPIDAYSILTLRILTYSHSLLTTLQFGHTFQVFAVATLGCKNNNPPNQLLTKKVAQWYINYKAWITAISDPVSKVSGVIIGNHLNMKLYVEHIKRTCLISRTNVTRQKSITANLLKC